MADAPETAAPAPSSGGSKLVPALVGLNSALVAALIAMQLLRGGSGGGAATARETKEPAVAEKGAHGPAAAVPGPTQKLADFVVHLRDPETDRFARVSFELEVATEEDKARLAPFTPRIRDAFIAYLSDRTLEEMRGSEAIRRTKAALEAQLPDLAPNVKIRALYVTDLVIQ
jgi:flagellar FliL protein